MISAAVLCIVVFVGSYGAQGYNNYEGKCPAVEPVANFQMKHMLGKWYVIAKTSVGSSCLVYRFTRGHEPGEYGISQSTEYPVAGIPYEQQPLREYGSKLTVPEFSSPGIMKMESSPKGSGDTTFTVFSTDYNNYAAVFTCQKEGSYRKESVAFLSREKWLAVEYLDQIRSRILSMDIKPRDLSVISRYYCLKYMPKSTGFEATNVLPDLFNAKYLPSAPNNYQKVMFYNTPIGSNTFEDIYAH